MAIEQTNKRRWPMLRALLLSSSTKIGAALIGYGFAVLLARQFSQNVSGAVFWHLSLIMLSSTIARMGLDQYVVREISVTRGDVEGHRSLLGLTLLTVLGSSALLASGVAGIEMLRWGEYYWFGVLAIVPVALVMNLAAVFRACGHASLSLFIFGGSIPAFAIAIFWALPPTSTLGILVDGYSVAATLALIGTLVLVYRWLNLHPVFGCSFGDIKKLVSGSKEFALVSILNTLVQSGPMVACGFLFDDVVTAEFSVAFRTAFVISFLIVAVNATIAPSLARAHANNDLKKMKSVLNKGTAFLAVAALPPFLVFALYGEQLLGVVFGDSYRSAASMLAVLSFGQFVNAATGPVVQLLLMSRQEMLVRKAMTNSLIFVFFPGLLVAYEYGALGLSYVTMLTVGLANVVSVYNARRILSER